MTRGAVADGAGEHGHASNGQVTTGEPAGDGLAQVQLAGVERHRRLELAVGEVSQTQGLAADTGELLHVRVPWRQIGVADGPVDAVTVAQVGLEIEVTPSIAMAAPEQRPPAD